MQHHLRALREGPFSLKRGLNTVYVLFKLSIILCLRFLKTVSDNEKGDPVGSPSLELLCA